MWWMNIVDYCGLSGMSKVTYEYGLLELLCLGYCCYFQVF